MGEYQIAFVIWALVGCIFLGVGIASFSSKQPTGFWANAKMFEVTDVKRYNRTMGWFWLAAGGTFILLGIPLLAGENSLWIIVSMLGVLPWAVGLMVIYELVIARKFRKR